MSFSTLTIAASGEFMSTAAKPNDAIIFPVDPIFNPGVLDHLRCSYEVNADESRVANWVNTSTGDKKWEINADHIDSYADTAVKLAAAVTATGAACRLAPLRGAARPCMLVEVMSHGNIEFEFFNFRQGSLRQRDAEIRSELMAILQRKDLGQELYTIQIVDTAIGGQGIVALVDLLKNLHDRQAGFSNQSWIIDIHLLHPSNGHENVNRMDSVIRRTSDRFQVIMNRYPVPDLIVEDYDEALGFTLEREGSTYVAKPSVVAGRFLLKKDGVLHLIESEDLSRTFDEFMCEAVTNSLLTDPNRALVSVVWQDYVSKS
jgi:hypothetical protein